MSIRLFNMNKEEDEKLPLVVISCFKYMTTVKEVLIYRMNKYVMV